MFKWTKRIILWGFVGIIALSGAVWALGGGHAFSYLRSSGKMIRESVKDSIPFEFEIQRARDNLDDLIPEMKANLRLVASEEVEVAELETEMDDEREAVASERQKIQYLTSTLKTRQVSYTIRRLEYTRAEVVEELSRRFEHLRMADSLMKGKEELLRNRKRSLEAALKKLDQTRLARVQLDSQIEALEAQFRLLQAQSIESEFHIDESKITQTKEIITDLKKRLAIAQRVMARESKFVEFIPVSQIEDSEIVERVEAYLNGREERSEDGDDAGEAGAKSELTVSSAR